MTRVMNIVGQTLGLAAQVAIPLFIKNPNHATTIAGVVATAQGAISLAAHNYNPDGTSAKTPYVPGGLKTDVQV